MSPSTRSASTVVLVALLFAIPALSGCLGASSGGSGPTETNSSPETIRDPSNYTYVDNASFETGGHVHDYWGGQEEVLVLDKSRTIGGTSLSGRPWDIVEFRSDRGKVVPQGTETVEVTVDWTEDQKTSYDKAELRVRTAADDRPYPVAEVQPGDTVSVESTNERNDLPHRQLSAWLFEFVLHPVSASGAGQNATLFTHFSGEVSMRVVADRGLELPVFPAHPDQWNGREEIELLSVERAPTYWGNPTGEQPMACINQCPERHRPDNGTIVPFNADVVEVRLSYEPRTPGTDMGLRYHAADTWEWTAPAPDATDGDDRIYRIRLEEGAGDSPYATQSLWEFVPYPTEPREHGWVDGTYKLTAAAIRSAE